MQLGVGVFSYFTMSFGTNSENVFSSAIISVAVWLIHINYYVYNMYCHDSSQSGHFVHVHGNRYKLQCA